MALRMEGFVEISPVLRSGVYALVRKGRVVYVGKSRAMLGRINTHRRKWMDRKRKELSSLDFIEIPGLMFDEIHVRPCPLDQLDQLEADMIHLYKPHYNVQLRNQTRPQPPLSVTIGGRTLSLAPRPTEEIRRRA